MPRTKKAPLQENAMEDDDDEAMPPPKQQKKRKRREAKDRTPVMDGQTEEERRILRQEQRNLQDRIGERRAAMCALDSDEFKNQRASRRPAVLRRLHAIDATRVHLTMKWVVSFSSLSRFGSRRASVS